MNKYYRNTIAIVIILILSLTLVPSLLDLNFGYYQIIIIIAGLLGIYLNMRAKSKEETNT